MLKFLLSQISRALAADFGGADQETRQRWLRDPLSHPVLEGMSQRELGDLPFRR